jgi:hypothetical protein
LTQRSIPFYLAAGDDQIFPSTPGVLLPRFSVTRFTASILP